MKSIQAAAHPAHASTNTAVTRLGIGLRNGWSLMLHTMLPSVCLCCGDRSCIDLKVLCERCAGGFLDGASPAGEVRGARCLCCGLALPVNTDADQHSVPRDIQCGQCLSDPPAFEGSLIATHYAPPIDRMIQDLKFRSRLPLARAFGVLLARVAVNAASANRLVSADLILPVPLSSERLARRGFNQAMEIARPVARILQLPLAGDLCIRVRDTRAQTELPLSQRRVNMRGAFAIRQRSAIEGRHIVVIDDVMTTGHTLNELAACLKRHGAARVSNLVLARTPMR